MVYIITTDDVAKWAYDTIVARFTDEQWDQATKELRRLRRAYGNFFKLLDH